MVTYPLQDLLGTVALESHRNACAVVGEDLGTVSETVQLGMKRHGVLSYRLLYFERKTDGTFKTPVSYPAQALCAATTHDLPTLAGFWGGPRSCRAHGRAPRPLSPRGAPACADRRARTGSRAIVASPGAGGILPAGLTIDPCPSRA